MTNSDKSIPTDKTAPTPERAESQERLSLENNGSTREDLTRITAQQETVKQDTERLVLGGTLPDTSIAGLEGTDIGGAQAGRQTKPSDSSERRNPARESASGFDLPDVSFGDRGSDSAVGDRSTRTAEDEPDGRDGRDAPAQDRSESVKTLADDTAKRLAAAAGNPEEMSRIFSEAVSSFTRDNPTTPGTDFGKALNQSLRDTPGAEKLGVQFESSEGMRDGHANLMLVRDDGNSEGAAVVASKEHSFVVPTTREERVAIAEKIGSASVLGREQAPDTVQDIVDIADRLVMAHVNGRDPADDFAGAIRDFQIRHPETGPSALSGLLNDALRAHPIPSSLSAGFAGSEGVNSWSSASVSLIDNLKPKGHKTVFNAPLADRHD